MSRLAATRKNRSNLETFISGMELAPPRLTSRPSPHPRLKRVAHRNSGPAQAIRTGVAMVSGPALATGSARVFLFLAVRLPQGVVNAKRRRRRGDNGAPKTRLSRAAD